MASECDATSLPREVDFQVALKTMFQNQFLAPLDISLKDWDVGSDRMSHES